MSLPGIQLRIRLGFSYNDIKHQDITFLTFHMVYNIAIWFIWWKKVHNLYPFPLWIVRSSLFKIEAQKCIKERIEYIKGMIFQTFRYSIWFEVTTLQRRYTSEVNAHMFRKLQSYNVMKIAVENRTLCKQYLWLWFRLSNDSIGTL